MIENRTRILIADDDHGMVQSLRIRLEHKGFEVVTAPDGYRAIVEACEDPPDVLVLDVNMPAGNGFTVQERFEKLLASNSKPTKKIPVIYITGDKSEGVEEFAEFLGAFALIHKPFEIEHLFETIMRAMVPPPCAA